MSNNAILNKGIQIDSPHDLYKILKKYSFLSKGELKKLYTQYHLVLYGCGCDRQKNIDLSNQIYLRLNSIPDSQKLEFKSLLEVSFVKFNFEGSEIFRW